MLGPAERVCAAGYAHVAIADLGVSTWCESYPIGCSCPLKGHIRSILCVSGCMDVDGDVTSLQCIPSKGLDRVLASVVSAKVLPVPARQRPSSDSVSDTLSSGVPQRLVLL